MVGRGTRQDVREGVAADRQPVEGHGARDVHVGGIHRQPRLAGLPGTAPAPGPRRPRRCRSPSRRRSSSPRCRPCPSRRPRHASKSSAASRSPVAAAGEAAAACPRRRCRASSEVLPSARIWSAVTRSPSAMPLTSRLHAPSAADRGVAQVLHGQPVGAARRGWPGRPRRWHPGCAVPRTVAVVASVMHRRLGGVVGGLSSGHSGTVCQVDRRARRCRSRCCGRCGCCRRPRWRCRSWSR